MTKEIEEKASNYVSGRAMALSFKPLTLQDIREAYLCGAEDYAHISKHRNPWHKASEELPPYDKVVIVAYDGNTEDCCFNHRSNNPEVKTSENGWCDVGYDTEPTHWMEIPEIEED